MFLFQIEVVAKEKSNPNVKNISFNSFEIIWNRNTTDKEIQTDIQAAKKNGVIINVLNILRNKKNEITSITIIANNNHSKASASFTGIPKIRITNVFNGQKQISVVGLSENDNSLQKINNESNQKENNIIKVKGYADLNQNNSEYYIDDKRVSKSEFEKLDISDINSIEVKKGETNSISVKTKIIAKLDDKNVVRGISSLDGTKPLIIIDGNKTSSDINSISKDQIASINVLKGKVAVEKYGSDGKNGAIEITTKTGTFEIPKIKNDINKAMIIINGKKAGSQVKMTDINEKAIKSLNILKGKLAIEKYGEEGKDGVFEITTDTPDQIITKIAIGKPIPVADDWIVGYASNGTSNAISRIIDDKKIDYKKAVILIDGKQTDYKALEKVNPNDVERVIQADIKNAPEKDKNNAIQLYGKKVLNGFIQIETKSYNKN